MFWDLDGPILDVSKKYYTVYRDILLEHKEKPLSKKKYVSSILDPKRVQKMTQTGPNNFPKKRILRNNRTRSFSHHLPISHPLALPLSLSHLILLFVSLSHLFFSLSISRSIFLSLFNLSLFLSRSNSVSFFLSL